MGNSTYEFFLFSDRIFIFCRRICIWNDIGTYKKLKSLTCTSVASGERDLRAGAEEPEELPLPRPHLLQAHDLLYQQLDAHQDHQTIRGSHPSRAKVRVHVTLYGVQGCGSACGSSKGFEMYTYPDPDPDFMK